MWRRNSISSASSFLRAREYSSLSPANRGLRCSASSAAGVRPVCRFAVVAMASSPAGLAPHARYVGAPALQPLYPLAELSTSSGQIALVLVQDAWLRWRNIDRAVVENPRAFLTLRPTAGDSRAPVEWAGLGPRGIARRQDGPSRRCRAQRAVDLRGKGHGGGRRALDPRASGRASEPCPTATGAVRRIPPLARRSGARETRRWRRE